VYVKKTTPPLSRRRINERKEIVLDIEQIYGHGTGVGVPAGCQE
jgi:hypothetical protein